MLGMFSNKSDHPLANLKSAQQLLNDLPKSDAVEVLKELGQYIEMLFNPANGFRLDHQFAVLRMFDEAAHPYFRKITHSYFAPVSPNTFSENRLWAAMNNYAHFCDLSYLDLLVGLQQGEKGGAGVKSNLALICARGIYAVFAKMECFAVRYMQLDPLLWNHLAAYYTYAENEKCLDEPISIYAGSGTQTTVRRLFGCGLMWYTSGVGMFKPLDLHIAKRLITHLSKSFTVSEQSLADSLYVFDLAKPSSPAKAKASDVMYPQSVRFIGSGTAASQFGDILKTLGKDLVPTELNMGVSYSALAVADVTQLLAKCCNSPLPTRLDQRRKIKVNMNVVTGFSQVVDKVVVDFHLGDSDSWEVEDISSTGLSCILPAARANTVKIGALIGLQPDKVQHWSAGIVRRLSRDAQNNLRVGVEMLASKVVGIVMLGHDGTHADAKNPALFLDKPDIQNGEGWVLMKQDTFSINRSPTMVMGEQSYLMMPLGLVEKGEDFDLVRYRKMENDSSSDDSY